MANSSISQLSGHEHILALLELPPWNALYRIGIGGAIIPTYAYLFDANVSWHLGLWFVGVLIFLRLVPAVIRKVLPFSRELKSIWSERRMMAKRFDSYQWQKLFWLGIGMGGSGLILDQMSKMSTALIVFCLINGAIGVFVFRHRTASSERSVRTNTAGLRIT